MAGGIEFDWDEENTAPGGPQSSARRIEQVLNKNPLDLDYEVIDGEERYRSVGLTNGALLVGGVDRFATARVRAVTALPASVSNKKAFLETSR